MIKDKIHRSQKPGGKYRWAVCTDGSDKSIKAFNVLARIIDKSRDEVVAISVASKGLDINAIHENIVQHFKEVGVSKKTLFYVLD